MAKRNVFKKGEHKSVTRKSNTAWSDEAVRRNVKKMSKLIGGLKSEIENGVQFHEDLALFPKKRGFPINDVNIQVGNSKLGHIIHSVSLPPVLYCGNCGKCKNDCYDLRHDIVQAQCRIYRCANAAIYDMDPANYFDSISRQAQFIRYLRWHIGGDIVNYDYLCGMVRVARENPRTEMLAFTKMFGVVNEWIDRSGELPGNLHIIFSAWPGLEMDNRHNLPVAFPVFAEGDEVEFMGAMPSWYWHCGNDCTECALCGQGCWTLKRGEAVGFPLH